MCCSMKSIRIYYFVCGSFQFSEFENIGGASITGSVRVESTSSIPKQASSNPVENANETFQASRALNLVIFIQKFIPL